VSDEIQQFSDSTPMTAVINTSATAR